MKIRMFLSGIAIITLVILGCILFREFIELAYHEYIVPPGFDFHITYASERVTKYGVALITILILLTLIEQKLTMRYIMLGLLTIILSLVLHKTGLRLEHVIHGL